MGSKRLLGLIAGMFLSAGVAVADDSLGGWVQAVPVPAGGTVKIDGDFSEWDLSAERWFCMSAGLADTYGGTFATMYDDDALYLAVESLTAGPSIIPIRRASGLGKGMPSNSGWLPMRMRPIHWTSGEMTMTGR